MSTVEEIERVIAQLPFEDFQKLAAWMDRRQREREISPATPGGMAGTSQKYPGPERSPRAASVLRDHSSFLNSYVPEDEGPYRRYCADFREWSRTKSPARWSLRSK